jgi:hypothetical protein
MGLPLACSAVSLNVMLIAGVHCAGRSSKEKPGCWSGLLKSSRCARLHGCPVVGRSFRLLVGWYVCSLRISVPRRRGCAKGCLAAKKKNWAREKNTQSPRASATFSVRLDIADHFASEALSARHGHWDLIDMVTRVGVCGKNSVKYRVGSDSYLECL